MLLYTVLAKEKATRADLPAIDLAIEQYLTRTFGVKVDFDLEDALDRLMRDGIVMEDRRRRAAYAWPRLKLPNISSQKWDQFLDVLPDPMSAEGYEFDTGRDGPRQNLSAPIWPHRFKSIETIMTLQKVVADFSDRDLAHHAASALQDFTEPAPDALTIFENGPGRWRLEAFFNEWDRWPRCRRVKSRPGRQAAAAVRRRRGSRPQLGRDFASGPAARRSRPVRRSRQSRSRPRCARTNHNPDRCR